MIIVYFRVFLVTDEELKHGQCKLIPIFEYINPPEITPAFLFVMDMDGNFNFVFVKIVFKNFQHFAFTYVSVIDG